MKALTPNAGATNANNVYQTEIACISSYLECKRITIIYKLYPKQPALIWENEGGGFHPSGPTSYIGY